MNKRIKIGVTATFLGALVLSLLVVIPSPMTRISLVISAPTFENDTRILSIRLDNAENLLIRGFYENNVTEDIPVGQMLNRITVNVYISYSFAGSEGAAKANTRVYLVLRNPESTIVWENYVDNANPFEDHGTYWEVMKRSMVVGNIELTEGTWTIETRYDVYA